MKQKLTLLIGLPGTGKTTWRKVVDPFGTVLSSDDWMERRAREMGKTYTEAFPLCINDANTWFAHVLARAINQRDPIIIDRTNLTVKSRARIMDQFSNKWEKTAIVFQPNDWLEWQRKVDERAKLGKSIPADVLERMSDSYEKPTEAEGFSTILTYYT